MCSNEDEIGVPCERVAVHDITLVWRDGSEETIPVDSRETVIDAATRAGANLPFGCLTGACTTCTGRLLDGRIEHGRVPRALKPGHLDDGYTLLCIAEPRTDCRIEVGAGVQRALIPHPRK